MVFFKFMTHILVLHIYFFDSSIFNVSTAHKQGDMGVRAKLSDALQQTLNK